MPQPVGSNQRYMPGIDGLRAIAVIAVIAYHLGLGVAPGGLLGVGVFFTLSGYLITDLLLAKWVGPARRPIGSFWLGRARRLLPALFLMLAVVLAWVTLVGPAQPPRFRDAVGAAVLYVSNWQQIFQHVSYFARFGSPSPLQHLWSLGVEEQFYILWPFLLLAGVRLVRERPHPAGIRPRLAAATLFAAGGSAALMALLYRPSLDPSRVYYGTDTRAFELLIGAALAMVWPSGRLRDGITPGARRTLDGLGTVGLVGILAMVWRVGQYSPFLYEGGLVVLSVATALVLAALAHPACRLGAALGWRPLRWVGVRSYGIYLWHFPIFVLTAASGAGALSGGETVGAGFGAGGVEPLRALLQVAATVVVAALSWRFVEEPIRHGALGRQWRALRATGWGGGVRSLPRRGWVAAGSSLALVACAGVALAGPGISSSGRGAWPLTLPVASSTHVGAPGSAREGPDAGARGLRGAAAVVAGWLGPSPALQAQTVGGAGGPALRSSCRSVVHIGDSTSEGLTSHEYLPRQRERIEWQYAHVGVTEERFEISGARSIVETYEGYPNAYQVAREEVRGGYHGCWVLALGTNDTADVAVGSNTSRMERIEQMMRVTGGQPVMWVNVISLLSSGPYAEQNMRLWDEALLKACSRYPNMHVFDWAALAKPAWFIEDGIHYTTPGYDARSRLIAQALAQAFPESKFPPAPEPGCVVR